MRSPDQFSHLLIVRAKCDIVAAALGNGVVPSHNVTTEIRDLDIVREDARRANPGAMYEIRAIRLYRPGLPFPETAQDQQQGSRPR